jgi:hypothetical protein
MLRRLVLLLVLVVATAAFAGIAIDVNRRYEMNNCAAGGSSSVAPVAGQYLFRVTTADTWVCWSGTCASGGELFSAGTVFLLQVPSGGSTLSCRSTGANGNVVLTWAY